MGMVDTASQRADQGPTWVDALGWAHGTCSGQQVFLWLLSCCVRCWVRTPHKTNVDSKLTVPPLARMRDKTGKTINKS